MTAQATAQKEDLFETLADMFRPVPMMSAFCECCDAQDFGTREQLESAGWELNAYTQFCGDHA